MRKGQIGFFIIFGLIILIAFGFTSYLNNQKEIKEKIAESKTSLYLSTPIKNYIELCLKKTGEDALYFIGLQGGFFKGPDYKIISKGFFVDSFHAVYLYNAKNVMPSKQTMEREISAYVGSNLKYCINNFENFNDAGYKIESQEHSTTTIIAKNSVVFDLNFPVTVSKGKQSAKIEDFFVEIPSRLDLIHNLAKNLTDDQLNHLNQVCISCLIESGELANLYFELYPREANVTIIAIEDNQTKLDNGPYIFVFAFNHTMPG